MNRPRRFDLIAFDWDGTLFDSTALIVRCIQDACRDVGAAVPSDEAAAYVIGLGLEDALRHAAPGLAAEHYPQLGARYRRHYFARQHELLMFEGTLPMLQALRARHHWLAVATGKSRRGLDMVLQQSGLGALFDATRTADETQPKPDPRMLMELMRELGTEPARTLMIGDTTHDLQLAANAGVPAVAVSFGAHDPRSFAPFAPLFVARSTGELHDWLLSHG
ncbi:MAG TPA: HAD-IA family hydrolase [Rubrivivax sp.]|nr:HAD-IA family hydrolase [Burkholderiales bacterium]HNT39861.1 HAD-IA family hydrolase [Rubrivivax sp.]